MEASPVTVGSSACNCCSSSPLAPCCSLSCSRIPRFCRSPRAMASSSDRSITVPVAFPETTEPRNESCVGAARLWPAGAASCCSAPSTAPAWAGVVAPVAPLLACACTPAGSTKTVPKTPSAAKIPLPRCALIAELIVYMLIPPSGGSLATRSSVAVCE